MSAMQSAGPPSTAGSSGASSVAPGSPNAKVGAGACAGGRSAVQRLVRGAPTLQGTPKAERKAHKGVGWSTLMRYGSSVVPAQQDPEAPAPEEVRPGASLVLSSTTLQQAWA